MKNEKLSVLIVIVLISANQIATRAVIGRVVVSQLRSPSIFYSYSERNIFDCNHATYLLPRCFCFDLAQQLNKMADFQIEFPPPILNGISFLMSQWTCLKRRIDMTVCLT